jgi:hypothetical protein
MAIRTLKRQVIIREYDYKKVREEALAPLSTMGLIDSLYDRVSFMPVDQTALEKLKMLDILKGKKHTPIIETKWDLKMPGLLLWDLKDYLYDDRYSHWKVTTDEEGFMCVQARKNTPKSRLGWAVFEKDVESRL